MKAVQELAAYFDRRGRLPRGELRKLLDRGFLAAEAPPTMLELCDGAGTTYYFRITGSTEGQVWGTGVYTGDSPLAAAAVHAGLLKPGQTGILRVTSIPPPSAFQGSVRHGVASHDFGRFGTAYRLSAV